MEAGGKEASGGDADGDGSGDGGGVAGGADEYGAGELHVVWAEVEEAVCDPGEPGGADGGGEEGGMNV